ncbi:MAG: hypothetical protein LBU32_08060 [Clostridiales bacterium]|nr:hypothetical protein [Clostridiales bacterium]
MGCFKAPVLQLEKSCPGIKTTSAMDSLYADQPAADFIEKRRHNCTARPQSGKAPQIAKNNYEAKGGCVEVERFSLFRRENECDESPARFNAHTGLKLYAKAMTCLAFICRSRAVFAFPCTASIKISSGRMAVEAAVLGRKWRHVENEGFKSRKMQMHPARRSDRNPKAMKARQRSVQMARCILQLPRRHSEAIHVFKRASKDYNKMLKSKFSCSHIRLYCGEADSGGLPVFTVAWQSMEAGAQLIECKDQCLKCVNQRLSPILGLNSQGKGAPPPQPANPSSKPQAACWIQIVALN